MPLVLRKISKARWYIDRPWLQLHDIKADAAKDLATADGKLSIYLVDDDKSTLERVIAALGANGNNPDKVDYALVDLQLLTDVGFEMEQTLGGTPDTEVNALHRDIVNFSITKMVRFAFLIKDRAERERFSQPEVVRLVKNGIMAGHLNQDRMKPELLQKIGLGPADDNTS